MLLPLPGCAGCAGPCICAAMCMSHALATMHWTMICRAVPSCNMPCHGVVCRAVPCPAVLCCLPGTAHSPSPAVHLLVLPADSNGVFSTAAYAADVLVDQGTDNLWGVDLLGVTMAQLAILTPTPGGYYIAVCAAIKTGRAMQQAHSCCCASSELASQLNALGLSVPSTPCLLPLHCCPKHQSDLSEGDFTSLNSNAPAILHPRQR